jgi:hypothetical protein
MKNIIILLASLFIGCSTQLYQTQTQIDAGDLRKHVTFLASEELEGRDAGSEFEIISSNYVVNAFKQYGLETQIQSFEYNSIIDTMHKENRFSQNILGFIEGHGNLKDEWIIIGAHVDHLGWGGHGTASMVPNVHAIHNGADDNASGVSALIEIAELLINQPKYDNQRSVMLIAFGAEEVGLIGSDYYVKNPIVSLENTVAMLNMDMIGRLTDNTLIVGNTGTAKLWKNLVTEQNTGNLKLVYNDEGFATSDHESFRSKGIPVLFFFTGAHKDYHRPSDDIELINFTGLTKVTKLVYRTLSQLTLKNDIPVFIKSQVRKHKGPKGDRKFSIGIIPEFAFDGVGLKIKGVRKDGSAETSGLIDGDVIIYFNGIDVNNIYDYMTALQNITSSAETTIRVNRDNSIIEMKIIPMKSKN